jgi:hypothetical protein
VLPAVETPAEERATIINRASRSAEIHALAVCLGGEQKYRIPGRRIGHNAMSVRLDFVSLFRVENKTLITSTALSASVAGHVGLSFETKLHSRLPNQLSECHSTARWRRRLGQTSLM